MCAQWAFPVTRVFTKESFPNKSFRRNASVTFTGVPSTSFSLPAFYQMRPIKAELNTSLVDACGPLSA